MGNYGYGSRNDRGEKLLNFSAVNNLSIANTMFRQGEKVDNGHGNHQTRDYIMHGEQ